MVSWLQQNMLWPFVFTFCVRRVNGGQSANAELLGQRVVLGRAVNRIDGCESVGDYWDGLNINSVVQVGSGGASDIQAAEM